MNRSDFLAGIIKVSSYHKLSGRFTRVHKLGEGGFVAGDYETKELGGQNCASAKIRGHKLIVVTTGPDKGAWAPVA